MSVRAHLFISGRVQGVGFRASTRRKARELGIRGWVKNLPDGRVEAVFEGNEEDVKKIVRWCRKGPRAARVEDVDLSWGEPEGFDEFEVRY